ncbi:MAG TPA: NAD(P)/FAD-dependent oxidoreductase [Kofleriaceae bacterium]|nr:NAD(P)/FAD-dependent oxidoreductase [Kofleriaceae bacterium]
MTASIDADFDIVIIGGSYAGLSAALQAARARARVLVIDAGQRRNRFAAASHGFLGRDGADPAQIVAEARAQLLAYPTVTWRAATARAARPSDGGFAIDLDDAPGAAPIRARRIILATGVTDDLPAVPGLAERWGKSVFHCPYCHGYELMRGPIGLLASQPIAAHAAQLLPDWGQTTWFTALPGQPAVVLDDEPRRAIERRGATLEATPVAAIEGDDLTRPIVRLADGRGVALAGLFVVPRLRLPPLARALGLALEPGPLGDYVKTDAMTKETSLPGVFACGDVATPAGNVAGAVGDGARAGAFAHQSLIFRPR